MNALNNLTHLIRTPQPEARLEARPEAQPEHVHAWRTESSHSTSEGVVRYAHCLRCGGRRVDLRPIAGERSTLTEVAWRPREAQAGAGVGADSGAGSGAGSGRATPPTGAR